MTFDIIEIDDEILKNYSAVQMQLLRTAQKKKNELQHKMEIELAMFDKMILGNGMKNSTLHAHKNAELKAEFNYQVDILREQLLYALELNEPFPDQDEEQEMVGYIVDYTLTYSERYKIVREYYMSIEDPALRMKLYTNDDVAKRYLDSYYSVLYNVLYSYSR
ncbi:MAG: hypothetical protein J1F61_05980 [Clostridiales bacterium]|nr:hypothetical protein [Clostridiales bacterium]